jgi:hypothetical protein
MTNPATPTPPGAVPPPPGKGGIPTWAIILIICCLGIPCICCGGIRACAYLFGKGAQTALVAAQAAAEKAQQEATKAAEAQRAANGGAPAADQGNGGGGGGGGGGGAPAEPTVQATPLPPNFPSDLPVYTGMTPTFAMSDNTKGTGAVMFSSPDSTDKVIAYYQKSMTDQGWKEESNTSINSGAVITYSKSGTQASLTVSPDGTKSAVSITYGKK